MFKSVIKRQRPCSGCGSVVERSSPTPEIRGSNSIIGKLLSNNCLLKKTGSVGREGVCEETHVPKVVGSKLSTLYWMDIFSHLFVVKLELSV